MFAERAIKLRLLFKGAQNAMKREALRSRQGEGLSLCLTNNDRIEVV